LIHEYYPYLDLLSILFSVVINLFLLFDVKETNVFKNEYHNTYGWASEFEHVVGYIIIAIQCCLTLHFISGNLRIHIEYCWREWEASLRNKMTLENKENLALSAPIFPVNPKGKLLWPEYILRTLYFVATNMSFWQRVLFMVTAVLATEFHPFFYSVPLLQVIQKSPALQNVVLAVTTNGKTLLLTLLLMLITVYMFALIAYYEFSESLTNPELGRDFGCSSLLTCLRSLTLYGLRSGIDGIVQPIVGHDEYKNARLVFDMLFFALLNVIFMNIVFGIIIDTFASLREAREAQEEDQTGTCFICGIDKATFDRKAALSGGFDNHVDYEHNMWQYIYYMYYLQEKDRDELNGPELYVYDMIERSDISFFPIGRALVLKENEETNA